MESAIQEEKMRLRKSLSDSKTWDASISLSSFFDLFPQGFPSKPIGLYKPLKDEIQISDVSKISKPAWPKIVDKDQSLMLFSSSSEFRNSELGFQEPVGGESHQVSKDNMEVIFVPGVAFDFKGARLGRGKGFYDRYLSGYKGIKVGVCHWTRFLNKPIPVDHGHDIFMDWVLTDRHVFKVNTKSHAQINEVV